MSERGLSGGRDGAGLPGRAGHSVLAARLPPVGSEVAWAARLRRSPGAHLGEAEGRERESVCV